MIDITGLSEDFLCRLDTEITSITQSVLKESIFDMFYYYSSIKDLGSSIKRANCLGLCQIVAEKMVHLTIDSFKITSMFIPCDTKEFVPSSFSTFPYEHVVLGILVENRLVGILDPSYGIVKPLRDSGFRQCGPWSFTLDVDILYGIKNNSKEMHIQLFPEKGFTGTSNAIVYQGCLKPCITSGFSAILDSETGLRLNKLEVSSKHILYRSLAGVETYKDFTHVSDIYKYKDLILSFCRDVKVIFKNLELDSDAYFSSVLDFLEYSTSIDTSIN